VRFRYFDKKYIFLFYQKVANKFIIYYNAYNTQHYNTLHYTTLHYSTLHYYTLQYRMPLLLIMRNVQEASKMNYFFHDKIRKKLVIQLSVVTMVFENVSRVFRCVTCSGLCLDNPV